MAGDSITWDMQARIIKYHPETVERLTRQMGHEPLGFHLRHLESIGLLVPDEVVEAPGNLLVTGGLNRVTSLIIGGGGTALAHADAIVGVGTSTTAATTADTALGGDGNASTAYYQQADGGYPTQANGVVTCNCTYQSGVANFAWNEWLWAIASGTLTAGNTLSGVGTSPLALNHKVQSLGTKASGSIWTLSATLTLA
jgi:hypothetical protein